MKTDSNERPSRAGGAVLGLLLAITWIVLILLLVERIFFPHQGGGIQNPVINWLYIGPMVFLVCAGNYLMYQRKVGGTEAARGAAELKILFFGVLLWFPVTLALFLMQWGGHGQLSSMVGLLTMLIMLAIYTLWERRQYGDILLKAQSRTIHVKVAETRDHYLSPVFLSHTGVVLH
ncbi:MULTISPECIES: hypothetical protein [unclassified Methanoculleus]|jgi:hypothetical protein|uniref:Transmembrane protein n=1 Tax=Methanoculleus palmolei TaxID=72612 RepID=A0ABD8A616_9EURY|nr:hypothetical protein [Methanoculleus sp. UBA377]MDD2472816.1 hypothetical protein [Methanoculleus sp.]WOX54999.1 hypothetical protein R6Y95_05865 [Methanoculleus palmolei]